MNTINIFNRKIGSNQPVYIIAELSANHNRNFDLAVKTLEAMKEAGADAVKIQTYQPGSITLDSDKPWFKTREDSLWAGQKMYDLYKRASTPYEWHPKLKKLAESLGLDFFSSPFDLEGVDLLESLKVPAYKIASFEITDLPLISYVASKGKPVIISTGIARIEDIELALETCYEQGNKKVALLKCTSAYPAPVEEANLGAIPFLSEKFGVVTGLSDHTLGIEIPITAVALGARIIEKHFILDRSINTPDSEFSLDRRDFKKMVLAIRKIEKAIEPYNYQVTEKMKSAMHSARSLFAVKNIRQGEEFSTENISSLRPGLGLHPKYYKDILGKKAAKNIEKGTPLNWDLISE